MRGHDLAVLDHVSDHVAVGAARLHVRPQQIARAQVHDAKLLHQLGALATNVPLLIDQGLQANSSNAKATAPWLAAVYAVTCIQSTEGS